ncbi:hypothetical protein GCM10011507_26360 [Edaphobacter acidisoli]|uniref:Uncharacterized protein n=1 Tax=Edaphobacter acidisoli TaxID=2040573 RepID=A0A916W793_9BACT|nr:hypothetical protein GCM10011507_26360 [Edaphobacter acidisoli]
MTAFCNDAALLLSEAKESVETVAKLLRAKADAIVVVSVISIEPHSCPHGVGIIAIMAALGLFSSVPAGSPCVARRYIDAPGLGHD